ncbi:poly-gamma-glutamate hydrolase family protein [Dactylosporangium fulvum]|uniref:Poly-gamma-glutamate hydrolase family protein n=1 Tax=Dactylosporangium fulvum TaxID=53359 RepID=A0ABY5W7Y0_9ACTN|nr:poly-gamma-glutamate hydrolase family protein [Dactylosporangium fulvum]UWP85124.1 poly-gamma-glutamate hydrolase family protein [Dactylosporangium fulvum]
MLRDTYASNIALYADSALTEGVDYARRYRRHATIPVPDTVVLAVHGGGIEPGTSELCLAVAGYHPATGAARPEDGPAYDYWMFEGLRATDNTVLHVTATRCDDPVAVALTAGAGRAVSLHGCTPHQARLADGTEAVLVGGLDTVLKERLLTGFAAAGIEAHDATAVPALSGDDPANIVNRTRTGAGAQLELTTPLRALMFGNNTRARRRHTTEAIFWTFVGAVRTALR